MINIKRSYPAPESLEIEKNKELNGIKKDGSYKCDDVIRQLGNDSRKKCYICETNTNNFQVEHLKSHKGDIDLKFDWDNLFLACGHCNNIKNKFYDDILDCTKEDVESKIRYKMDAFPGAEVYIYPLSDDFETMQTVDLLQKCYNGTTELKKLDSENIREEIMNTILEFRELIIEYINIKKYEDGDPDDLNIIIRKIKRALHPESKYPSFKRWIIKDSKFLSEELGQYIPTIERETEYA
ncbi:hypothetical protein PN290_01530 [Romboutsia sp. 1001216sp1]|uniref:HNH endonuclease n=1 Tax=unclassified Romboutsia TaxID=2626894 RepID=UPI0018A9AD0C|nr:MULTISPECIES: HNH endonuclease [unclassified Romboutsia]MDB8794615.1 hypothetical protein [Romboutsia sp. 1001216sp1]MDB8796569.1 hypothetical protein [Romboutsia sp. 1001216sp1]MDB8798047.1 hypothetical protein [Romboutsia sp. 1001216sp1]